MKQREIFKITFKVKLNLSTFFKNLVAHIQHRSNSIAKK